MNTWEYKQTSAYENMPLPPDNSGTWRLHTVKLLTSGHRVLAIWERVTTSV